MCMCVRSASSTLGFIVCKIHKPHNAPVAKQSWDMGTLPIVYLSNKIKKKERGLLKESYELARRSVDGIFHLLNVRLPK